MLYSTQRQSLEYDVVTTPEAKIFNFYCTVDKLSTHPYIKMNENVIHLIAGGLGVVVEGRGDEFNSVYL